MTAPLLALMRKMNLELKWIRFGILIKYYEKNNVFVCSSNYALFGDISHRIMSLLNELSPRLEVYSIDEAFLGLEGLNGRLAAYVHDVRNATLG
jgi:DNA polymerase V